MSEEGVDRFIFCSELKRMLETRKAVGRSGKIFQGLSAVSTLNNLWILRSLCLEMKPRNTLEIGLAFGASALTIMASHRDLTRPGNKQHVAVDPFQSTVWDDAGRIMIEKSDFEKYISVYEEYSYVALPKLLGEMKKFDLIYIDGSHLFEDVFIDFYYSNLLLENGGLILFDDSSHPDVRKVLNFLDSNFSDSYKKVDVGHLFSGYRKWINFIVNVFKKNQLTVYRKVNDLKNRSWDSRLKDF